MGVEGTRRSAQHRGNSSPLVIQLLTQLPKYFVRAYMEVVTDVENWGGATISKERGYLRYLSVESQILSTDAMEMEN